MALQGINVFWVPKFLGPNIVKGSFLGPEHITKAKIGHPHRTYLSKSDGLGYRPSKLKKVSTEMKLEKVSTESPSIVKL